MISAIQKPEIISVLASEGIELQKKGKALWGLCPFHSEKTPSFKVDSERQSFYCFGCSASGDSITFIQKYKKISFKKALKYFGIEGGKNYLPDPMELRKKELIANFQAWCREYFAYLCDLLIRFDKIKKSLSTEKQVEAYDKYYHLESLWQFRLEILEGNDARAKVELYREVQNEVI